MTRTDTDERGLDITIARKRAEVSENGLRPSKYLGRNYGINARDHDDPTGLWAAVVETAHNDD